MSSTWRHAASTLVSDLRHVFADRLRSVVAYGPRVEGAEEAPLTCMALVESCSIADLDGCARLAPHWERREVAIPLILPQEEFRRSLDAFPLEYEEIQRAHEVVFGTNPFDGASISAEDLRRACETQIKSHLVHLREGFIEAAGRPHAVAELVTASAPAFAALLRHVARLARRAHVAAEAGASASTAGPATRVEATHEGARAAGLPQGIVADILALERPATVPTADAARLFPPYLGAVEQLARAVDMWRS
jgi:hypothetical protein